MTLGPFAGVNAGYVLELYERYRQNPESVDPATREAFESWTPTELDSTGRSDRTGPAAADARRCRRPRHRRRREPRRIDPAIRPSGRAPRSARLDAARRSVAVAARTRHHRRRSEAAAGVARRRPGRRVVVERLRGDREAAPHLLLDDRLRLSRTCSCPRSATGCGTPPSPDASCRRWIRTAREALLDRITQVEVFERFLHRTFPGKTRFSIEGLDMLVPILDEIICGAADQRRAPHDHRHGAPRPAERARAHPARSRTRRSSPSSRTRSPPHALRIDLGWMGDVKYHAGARTAGPRGQMLRDDAAESEPSRGRQSGRRGHGARRRHGRRSPGRAAIRRRAARCRS